MTRYVGIDPSSETGLALIDMHGNYLDGLEIAPEIENKTVKICEIVEEIFDNLEIDDVVAIEGFSYGSKGQGIDFQFGLGHAIRLELYRQDMKWIEVAPTQVKKYATGNHQASKNNMVLPIYKHWGFEHNSDNVRDAFVLAQIARATQILTVGTKYQEEVIQAILDPKPKKKKRA